MIVFSLSAPIFGLISAILLGLAEISLLAGILNFINLSACNKLITPKGVQISRYRTMVLTATVFSIFIFVSVETVLSLSSNPEKRSIFEQHECLQTRIGLSTGDIAPEAEAIQFVCTKVQGRTVSHKTGNFSERTEQIRCDSVAYSYVVNETTNYNPSMGKFVRRCVRGLCAATTWTPNAAGDSPSTTGVLHYSELIPDGQKDLEGVRMLPTLLYTADLSANLSYLSERVAGLYVKSVNEGGEARRRLLLGSQRTKCPFVKEEFDVTVVSTWAFIFSSIIGIGSLSIFIGSQFIRRRIFFDVGNPMHWATKARHDETRPEGPQPRIRVLDDGEHEFVWIIDYYNDKTKS